MNPILEGLLDKGFELIVTKSDGIIRYTLEGFYKSGTVTMYESQGRLWVDSRYNQTNEIHTFRDLVLLNYDWWIESKDRSDGWKNPHEDWLEYFIEMDLVKEKTNTIYCPKSD